MIKTTWITWLLAVFGGIIFLILTIVNLIIVLNPKSQKTKDIYIGKGEEWRDKTHSKYALAFAWGISWLFSPFWLQGMLVYSPDNYGGISHGLYWE